MYLNTFLVLLIVIFLRFFIQGKVSYFRIKLIMNIKCNVLQFV